MNLLNQEKDNITKIVKSLRPIKYLYSKQNKDFDKYFRGSNLKDFVKQINAEKKFNVFLGPGEQINEFTSKNTDSNVVFKNAFNYFEELSNLKKLPLAAFKKGTKTSRYNSENSKYNKYKKIKKKKNKRNEEIKLKKIRNNADEDVTLDPGRYNPNYDFIRRRYPCAYLGKPKKGEDSTTKTLLEQEKESEDKSESKNKLNEIKKEINENNKNIKTNRNLKLKEEKDDKKLLISYSNRTIDEGKINDLKYKRINFKIYNDIKNKREINEKMKSDTQQKFKMGNSPLKLVSTVSSLANTNYIETTKRDKNQSLNNSNSNFYNTQRAFRNHKIELTKKSSCENLRCPIMFDKMPGRDRPANFMQRKSETFKVGYSPNYNFVRPHIPSTIFRSQRKYQEIKKYLTNKIIRSYYYNPERYFVLDFNKNKENEITNRYRSLLLNIY